MAHKSRLSQAIARQQLCCIAETMDADGIEQLDKLFDDFEDENDEGLVA